MLPVPYEIWEKNLQFVYLQLVKPRQVSEYEVRFPADTRVVVNAIERVLFRCINPSITSLCSLVLAH